MAWTWAATIIYRLKHPPHMDGNMKRLGVRQCLFNKKTPSAGLKVFKLLWSLLRGVVWSLWTDRIDRIYRAQSCSNHTIGCIIIHGIIAYERLEWEKVLLQIKRVPLAQYLHSFERLCGAPTLPCVLETIEKSHGTTNSIG